VSEASCSEVYCLRSLLASRSGCRQNSGFACTGGVAGTVGLFFRVFISQAWVGIVGAAARNGVRPATFIAHLRGVLANAVFVQQMTQRTDRHFQKVRRVGLVAVSAAQGFQHISLFQLI